MNPEWFGDSYDIVKRFFVEVLRGLGYAVYVDPMTTGKWKLSDDVFFEFLGATDIRHANPSTGKTALLLDPDTGIGRRPSKRHTTVTAIIDQLDRHEVVLAFDQSFSRGTEIPTQLQRKLEQVRNLDACGFYYDSHARFLFCTRSIDISNTVQGALVGMGLPESRILTLERLEARIQKGNGDGVGSH